MRLRTGIRITAGAAVLALGVATIIALAIATSGGETVGADAPAVPTHSSVPTVSAAPYVAPTAVEVAELPEAKYDAVIPDLIAYAVASAPEEAATAYTLAFDTAIYGADRNEPVARFDAINFLGDKSVIVPVAFTGDWALVLTPARRALPSAAPGNAPAQTAGWGRAHEVSLADTADQRLCQRSDADDRGCDGCGNGIVLCRRWDFLDSHPHRCHRVYPGPIPRSSARTTDLSHPAQLSALRHCR